MKRLIPLLLLISCSALRAQDKKVEVMTLGCFHFNFPNLDVQQVSKNDQIDVLEPKYQKEIVQIAEKIARFKPTVIVIERFVSEQHVTDSTLNQYVQGKYSLKRDEAEQIGFRLASQLGIKTLYCVDEWGNFTERINGILNGQDSLEATRFENYFNHNPDSSKRFIQPRIFKTKGILPALVQANDETTIKKDMGNYLIGLFKYESKERDFTGVDFETGRWFSRNLKIFRNIQRIAVQPTDRILVIYGAGHLTLLNYFFECSPEYQLARTNDYLR
ncbi:DUF5694 domain-containing protein [Flavihumibacter rivuli]|uniref:DUF5694 domain-containing protein n=1 Tax=Flavihumibacter rivuli TaxID=2838156 RepID=UPI001BDF272E|nr:DUF5694 domain-containing protein [Flavihumibacter rivuli]ULQ57086.1 DUF5694 domain-containing protein [Flavihumibacter rivuli]